MKKYFFKTTAILLLLVGVISSCSQDEVIYDGSPAISGFAKKQSQLPVYETGGRTSIVVNVSNATSSDRVIEYVIDPSKSTALASQYKIVSAIVPANSYNGYIVVTSDYANVADEPVTLAFILKKVGEVAVQEEYQTNTLSIKRSCPLDLELIAMTSYVGISYTNGDATTVFFPTLKQSASKPNEFLVDTLWGENLVASFYGYNITGYDYAGKLILNDDLTVTIYGFEDYATGGYGTYDPCTNTFNYVLTNDLQLNWGEGNDAKNTLPDTPVLVDLTPN